MASARALRRPSRGFGPRTVDPEKPNDHHRASIRPPLWLGLATRGIVPRNRHRDVLLARRSRTANRPRTARTPCQTDLSGLPRAPGMPNPRPHRRGTLRHLGWHVRDRTRPPRPAPHPAACPLTSPAPPADSHSRRTGAVAAPPDLSDAPCERVLGGGLARNTAPLTIRVDPQDSSSFGPDTPNTPTPEPWVRVPDRGARRILASR